jgi:hypothetical protein
MPSQTKHSNYLGSIDGIDISTIGLEDLRTRIVSPFALDSNLFMRVSVRNRLSLAKTCHFFLALSRVTSIP